MLYMVRMKGTYCFSGTGVRILCKHAYTESRHRTVVMLCIRHLNTLSVIYIDWRDAQSSQDLARARARRMERVGQVGDRALDISAPAPLVAKCTHVVECSHWRERTMIRNVFPV